MLEKVRGFFIDYLLDKIIPPFSFLFMIAWNFVIIYGKQNFNEKDSDWADRL